VAARVLDQPPQEVEEDGAGEALLEDAEPECAGVRDGGDDVGLQALAGALGDRGLADRLPCAPGAAIRAQAGLVGPHDLRALTPGALLDFGVAREMPPERRAAPRHVAPALVRPPK
jgi:hypothetical protein